MAPRPGSLLHRGIERLLELPFVEEAHLVQESVRIVLDDGDGTFEDGIDLDVLNVGAPPVAAGVGRFVLADDDPDLRQPPETSASYSSSWS